MREGTHESYGSIPPSISQRAEGEESGDSEGEDGPLTAQPLGFDPGEVASTLDDGGCPWCDAGPFDRARHHARQKHPDEYERFERHRDRE